MKYTLSILDYFIIPGNPAEIRERTKIMRDRASDFDDLGNALKSVSTDGWVGRAADRFHERFKPEPDRWIKAANGFRRAAAALVSYADALASTQEKVQICKQNYEEAVRRSEEAEAEYEKSIAEGYQKKLEWESQNGPGTYTLTIRPFEDPGEEQRSKAIDDYFNLRDELSTHGEKEAVEVRASCNGADESRNWLTSGLAFAGGVILGALESVGKVVGFTLDLQYGIALREITDLAKMATGELTQEEWIAKKSLPANEAAEVAQAAMSNPTEFGGALVNSILDIDNLKDDPARALGGYIPDAALLMASGGVSALSKAAKTIRTVKGAVDKGNKLKGGMKAMNGTLDAQHSEKASESVDEASQESHLGKLHELADSL